MTGPAQAPTRAAVLELQHEQVVVQEAYVFLDEKRLLLAAELLRQLRRYQKLAAELAPLRARAAEALRDAVMHHGLEGLQAYPAIPLDRAELAQRRRNFMGVTLTDTELRSNETEGDAEAPVNPSEQAQRCRRLHREVLDHSAVLAGLFGNLHRLLDEYRITERRSRALENVILPEIQQTLQVMSAHLEEIEIEDAIRVCFRSTR